MGAETWRVWLTATRDRPGGPVKVKARRCGGKRASGHASRPCTPGAETGAPDPPAGTRGHVCHTPIAAAGPAPRTGVVDPTAGGSVVVHGARVCGPAMSWGRARHGPGRLGGSHLSPGRGGQYPVGGHAALSPGEHRPRRGAPRHRHGPGVAVAAGAGGGQLWHGDTSAGEQPLPIAPVELHACRSRC